MIRSAQAKDFVSIQSIYAIEVREHTATFEITPPDIQELTIRWRHIMDIGLPYLVAELDGDIVECPSHFWHYNIKTGELQDYLKGVKLQTYAVEERNDGIYIDLE